MRTEIGDAGGRRERRPAVRRAAEALLLVFPLLLTLLLGGCAGASDDEGSDSPVGADTVSVDAPGVASTAGGAPSTLAGTVSSAVGKDSARGIVTSSGGARVLIAGTSLTAGLGLDPDDAYPAILQQLADSAGLPAHIVNGGSSGETSAGLVRRMDWLLAEPPAVVVIETGANDGLRGVDPAATKENLRQIVATVRKRAPAARVLLVQMEAPPNLGEAYTSRFRAMYADVARETGSTLVPFLLDGVAGVPSLNQADGIHPNEAGAQVVARTVWRSLAPVIREVDRTAGIR